MNPIRFPLPDDVVSMMVQTRWGGLAHKIVLDIVTTIVAVDFTPGIPPFIQLANLSRTQPLLKTIVPQVLRSEGRCT